MYSTLGCHLCEEAEAVLLPLLVEAQAAGVTIEVEVIDIAEEGLIDAYGVRIPVLGCAQTERELDWPFDVGQVRELLLG
ncbi:MAG TPA: glutaredoxin family protein [Cellvibrionaceae bacterium]|nr:glutaredoxin family protein [Cellvibrionaceae bacterium]HMY40006.1 glutaredoxin family protein [Marinagarivorans sp.]